MPNTVTIRARAARWAESDAQVPFFDERTALRNGTNPGGRRPHSFMQPARKPVYALIADNDNMATGGGSYPSDDAGRRPARSQSAHDFN